MGNRTPVDPQKPFAVVYEKSNRRPDGRILGRFRSYQDAEDFITDNGYQNEGREKDEGWVIIDTRKQAIFSDSDGYTYYDTP